MTALARHSRRLLGALAFGLSLAALTAGSAGAQQSTATEQSTPEGASPFSAVSATALYQVVASLHV